MRVDVNYAQNAPDSQKAGVHVLGLQRLLENAALRRPLDRETLSAWLGLRAWQYLLDSAGAVHNLGGEHCLL